MEDKFSMVFSLNDTYSSILVVFPQPTTKLFINGQFVESKTDRWIDIHNPVSVLAMNI